MLFKKIVVKTGTMYPEGLDKDFISKISTEFSMYIWPFTTNMHMLLKASKACKYELGKDSLVDRFQVVQDGRFYCLDGKGKLHKLIEFLGNPASLYLDYAIGLPGGFDLDEKDGIRFFVHTKELRHVPHIHARYQGEVISIEILTLKVRGAFKNKKKQQEAICYVELNRDELLKQYNLKTNGIHICACYVEDGQVIS